MREGSLDAPIRHSIPWTDPDFYDAAKLDDELRRVFDICHGCRRCFNLCDSFPRLFDLIDDSESGELDTVASAGFKPVIDACTLCDMCFLTKCPYVPPHEFNLDFPHLMLRARAIDFRNGKVGFFDKALAETDRNGKLAGPVAGLANWATGEGNRLTRGVMQSVVGIARDARLPAFHGKTFTARARDTPAINTAAPAHGRKAVLYATCFVNYNNPAVGVAARAVLARNGVETEVVYPTCCGMPKLEQGDIADVAARAKKIAAELRPWVDKGYDIIGLVPSCTLMLKFEWPLIVPDDDNVLALKQAAFDLPEYIVAIARKEGLADGLQPIDDGITCHIACHARAQNMGQKAAEMLRLIPEARVDVVERCSGHGGSWGVKKDWFDVALKVGKPVARAAARNGHGYIASECPLAADHILQGMDRLGDDSTVPPRSWSPIEIVAKAYGIAP